MNSVLIAIVGLIYLLVSINYFVDGKVGMGIVFIAYACANYGLWMAGEQ